MWRCYKPTKSLRRLTRRAAFARTFYLRARFSHAS